MEIIAGVQEYDVAANWKLMVENSVDDYHLPATHSTWLNFMANSGVKIEPPKEEGLVLPTRGKAVELGNGHFTTTMSISAGGRSPNGFRSTARRRRRKSTTSAASWSAASARSARGGSRTPTATWSSSPIW
jgi:Ring hydroxylating alpha subunit (catalytic domain).